MRKNARWAQSGIAAILGSPIDGDDGFAARLGLRNKRTSFDNPLIAGFTKLKSDIAECEDISKFSSVQLFAPFLEVISAPSTTGPITSIALSSVSKFIDYDVVTIQSPDLQLAIGQLAVAITHCRFEATDQAEDDAVLLRILLLMETIVCGIGNELLSDESVCEIIETCLSMACQMRRGDVLRRSAEMTIIKLSQVVFARIKTLEPEELGKNPEDPDNQAHLMAEPSNIPAQDYPNQSADPSEKVEKEVQEDFPTDQLVSPPPEGPSLPPAPYGIATIKEFLRVLISIIDPANLHQYTDSTRVMALRLINIAFEVAGKDIALHPSLVNLITTTLSKHLLQLIRYEGAPLLQATLRAISTILHTSRNHLKLQQELFITYLLTCLSPFSEIPREDGVDKIFYDGVPNMPKTLLNSPHPSTSSTPVAGRAAPSSEVSLPKFLTSRSPDSRELMVECITGLVRIPSFFTDLFVNYDCDVDRADLCEDLIGFLCRNAYPDSASWSTPSVPPLCLEAILSYISLLSYRVNDSPVDLDDSLSPEELMKIKARKKLVIDGTTAFNQSPSKGIAQLIANGIIPDSEPVDVAHFVKNSGRLDKKILGEYLAKPKNKEIMENFIEEFEFGGRRIDEALRELLSSFRLPGESQQIERLIEKFAERYCNGEGNTADVANQDAAFVLSYAVIMLNTDLHNPQVKQHMTIDEFKNNLRKVNDNKDFAPEYLEAIYHAIRQREIIMPDEHYNDESFEHAYKELLLKSSQAGKLQLCRSNIYDQIMFTSTWQPMVTTLAYVFATAVDDAVNFRVISGFDHASRLASFYNVPDVIDQIVVCLCKISTLSIGDLKNPHNNVEVEIDGVAKVVVSDLSVHFGRDVKAQLSSVVLFRILNGYMNALRTSWTPAILALANLYVDSLIPPVSNLLGLPPLAPIKPVQSFKRSKAGKDVGLLSTLSSYLTGYTESLEPSDEEVDASLIALDCVGSWDMPTLLQKLPLLEGPSLDALIDSIISIVGGVSDRNAATLFLLELATGLTLREVVRDSPETNNESDDIESAATSRILGLLHKYISSWELLESPFLSRVLNYALVVVRNSATSSSALAQLLSSILSINRQVLDPIIPDIVVSLASLADQSAWCCGLVMESADYWELIRIAASNRHSSSAVFEFLEGIVQQSPKEIVESNFGPILYGLGEIASAGASGAQLEQKLLDRVIEHQGPKKKLLLKESIESDVKRALKALEIIYTTDKLIDSISYSSPDAAMVSWYIYIQVLSQQCINPCRQIRSQGFQYYQRVILSPDLHGREGFEWIKAFDECVFPVIDALLKPEVYETDPKGMTVTRLHAASLICRVFLQYVVQVQKLNQQVLDLWVRILDTLDRLINSGQRDSVEESVVESLKNVLLVMSGSEFGADDGFWSETWKRIDELVPGLRRQLSNGVEDINDTNENGKANH